MQERRIVTWDGNEAAADVAFRINEVISIYPITPASPMGEHADSWAAAGRSNIWGDVPQVVEMQSEAGAAGAVHGSLQAGALTTTFTASQGLLLMIPNMFKIAGELTSAVIHIAARSIATHALSIFGDHSDIYSARTTGFGMLGSGSVQEAHDFALIAQAASLRSRVPFLHFFEGFRVSHEIAKCERLADADLDALLPADLIAAHKARALTPDRPKLRGTAQNPDVFFQAREACNPYYDAAPGIVQEAMDAFAEQVGRSYHLFDYVGAPDADRVVVIMGCGGETVAETVEWLAARGEKVGVVRVRLFRPFSNAHLIAALPDTVKAIGVLDRTKESGAAEPLYLDVVGAVHEARMAGTFAANPIVVGGRYGLSSKEFTPAMVVGLFDELKKDQPANHFALGIVDDLSGRYVEYDDDLDIEPADVTRAVFYGLGADGTVGANKNSIKIIGEETDNFAQGYFVYDSKKSGAVTVSHLRFGPRPIQSHYLVKRAGFLACHQWVFLDRYDVLDYAAPGAVFLLNAPYGPDEVWDHLPTAIQQGIADKGLEFYVIDAYQVARDSGMGGRINTIMQTCFFAISGVLPRDEAIERIKYAIKKTYGSKGDAIVQRNYEAVDHTLAHLHQVAVPERITGHQRPPIIPPEAPEFLQRVTATIMSGKGDSLPVSAFDADGTWPTATTQWEKRGIAQDIPIWAPDICIQCNKCALVCPHGAIRAKVYDPALLDDAPAGFKALDYKGRPFKGMKYTLQVAPEDCTGCTLCIQACPAKDKTDPRRKPLGMAPLLDNLEHERACYDFFLDLPKVDTHGLKNNVKDSQLREPLFEYSGACAGCGETPYVKLVTQLFGDRMLIANATGCSSIYGGNLPTTPYCVDDHGRGPAWSNSLFEDNAEFGVGFRLAVDQTTERARRLLVSLSDVVGQERVAAMLEGDQADDQGIAAQRARVEELRALLSDVDTADARALSGLADYLVRKSVWIFGGDGWAYDIGYGGLDHALALGRDVNILVMDTEVYSNTGGQASKATPMGAVAKFAAAGRPAPKKDLGMLAMTYGNVYVAQVAMGANDNHVVRAIVEAESYRGPSLVIAYSHCIAHGYNLANGLSQQAKAVATGHWPLYRFDPRLKEKGKNPFQLDSKAPTMPLAEYAYNETRYAMLRKSDPERARMLMTGAQAEVEARWARYQELANK